MAQLPASDFALAKDMSLLLKICHVMDLLIAAEDDEGGVLVAPWLRALWIVLVAWAYSVTE